MSKLENSVLKLYNNVRGNPDRLMNAEEICDYLNIGKPYLYQLTMQKRIPHLKIGRELRFHRAEIESWLESQEVLVNGNHKEREQGKHRVVSRRIL